MFEQYSKAQVADSSCIVNSCVRLLGYKVDDDTDMRVALNWLSGWGVYLSLLNWVRRYGVLTIVVASVPVIAQASGSKAGDLCMNAVAIVL